MYLLKWKIKAMHLRNHENKLIDRVGHSIKILNRLQNKYDQMGVGRAFSNVKDLNLRMQSRSLIQALKRHNATLLLEKCHKFYCLTMKNAFKNINNRMHQVTQN